MRIPGLGRAKNLYSQIAAPFQSRVAILMYHRVFEAPSDFWSICVSPKNFKEHLECLSGNFRVMTLRELMRCLKDRQLPKRAVVLTFDDGYADNFLKAKPLLERYNTPATMFVSTGSLDTNREFWWDELENLVLMTPSFPEGLQLTIRGNTHHWAMMDCHSSSFSLNENGTKSQQQFRHEVYKALHQLLRPITQAERDVAMNQLWSQMKRKGRPRSSYRALTSEEVRRLSDPKIVEIGAHTVTHPMLPLQDFSTQQWEMKESRRKLEEIVGQPVTSFAYPYGKLNQTSVQIAKELGFESACSTINLTVKNVANYFTLPRFPVGNWGGDEFASNLQRFFLK